MDFDALDDSTIETIARAAPMAMRVEMAKTAAREQDMRVLGAMTAAGCFDFDPSMLQYDHSKSNQHISYAKYEIPIIAAWACILENTSPVSRPTEHSEARGQAMPPKVPRTFIEPVTDEFKNAFSGVVSRFAESASAHLREKSQDNPTDGLNLVVFETMLSLGAAACAMNERHSVAVIAAALKWMSQFERPEDVPSHARLTPNVLGFNADLTRKVQFGKEHEMHRSHPVRISPWTLALEFDSRDALNVVGTRFLVDGAARYMIANDEGRSISAAELIHEQWLGASPDAWRQMMKGVNATSPDHRVKDAISGLTVSAMKGPSEGAWLDAALESGMQKFDPTSAVKACMSRSNGGELIEKLRSDIPWVRERPEDGHILFEIISRARLYRREGGLEVLSRLLHMAKEDGHWDGVMQAIKPEKNKLGGPDDTVFEYMAHHGCSEALMTMLELGFNPRLPGPSGHPALERIQKKAEPEDFDLQGSDGRNSLINNGEALRLIRSWQARNAAREALSDLDARTAPSL